MSFTKPGPMWGYVTGDLIDESEINYWCSKFPDCIDGAGGGTYNLSAPLSLLGDTVTFDEIEVDAITGDTVFTDDVSVSGELSVDSDADFAENVSISEDLRVFGEVETQTLKVNHTSAFTNAATFSGAVTVNGALTANDPVSVTDSLTTSAAVTLGGSGVISIGSGGAASVELNSTTNVYKPIRPQVGGFTTKRIVVGADANTSYGPKSYDEIFLPSGTLTADRIYTIDDTDAVNGCGLRIVNLDATYRVRVNDPGGNLLIYVRRASAVTTAYDVEFRRISGSWVLVGTTYVQ